MIALKLVVFAVLVTALFSLVGVALHGRRMVQSGAHAVALNAHESRTNVVLYAMVTAIVLLLFVRHSQLFEVRNVPTWLFDVHLPFAVAFLSLFLVAKFRFTGMQSRNLHRALTYSALGSFAVAWPTGIAMLYMM